MDPFLENPNQWPSFHTLFIGDLAASLNSVLPQQFAAKIEERLYVLQDERDLFVADIAVRDESRFGDPLRGGNTAVLEQDIPSSLTADEPQFMRVEPKTIRERYIEIISIQNSRQVVTVIEVLSPSNKQGEGRRKYLRKQREILRSKVNLVEIDLLRRGALTVAIPYFGLQFRPPFDYLTCLSRADERERVAYWPSRLRERLPRITVPLTSGEADIVEDLQAVLAGSYDRGAFSRTVDYTEPLAPPLSPEDTEWADEILRAASIRS
jgi:hypothetical protein